MVVIGYDILGPVTRAHEARLGVPRRMESVTAVVLDKAPGLVGYDVLSDALELAARSDHGCPLSAAFGALFADPPYDADLLPPTLSRLAQGSPSSRRPPAASPAVQRPT